MEPPNWAAFEFSILSMACRPVWSRKWKVLDYTPLIMSKRPSATLL
jgi:hypothetical protein